MPDRHSANAIVSLALLAFAMAPHALAQDAHGQHGNDHNLYHHWYKTLKQPGTGLSCCNDEDCRPTVSRVVDNVVQVLLDGEWTPVPREKILKTPSPDLGSHVCAPKASSLREKGFLYCVILGSGV